MADTGPKRLKKICLHPACGALSYGNYCDLHKKKEKRLSASKRGYGTRWRKVRKFHLAEFPLCEMCKPMERLGNEVDHIIPHKGDYDLMWEPSNWQTLCKYHHSQKTAREVFHGDK